MVVEKNLLNFSWHQKKFGRFVFYKLNFTWKRISAIRKDKKKKKVEEWLHERPRGVSLGTKRSSTSLSLAKSSSHGEDPEQQKNMKKKKRWKNGCKKKPVELFSLSRKLHMFVFCNEGVNVKKFVEKNPLSFFRCQKKFSAERRSTRSE